MYISLFLDFDEVYSLEIIGTSLTVNFKSCFFNGLDFWFILVLI